MKSLTKLTLLKAIVGSQAYGTNTPDSDTDYKEIYVQNIYDVSSFNYCEQYSLNKDHTLFEVKRFLQLLQSSNPGMLELLFTPDNCIIEQHELFKLITEFKYEFLTKNCLNSFVGYAKQQIHRAKGLNKKMNWESDKTVRKRLIDFMVVINKHETMPLSLYLSEHSLKEEFCGLIKLNNLDNIYGLYYDHIADSIATTPDIKTNNRYRDWKSHGYKGICNNDQLLLSSVPTYQLQNLIVNISYNQDGFQKHCTQYNSYQEWLANRNTTRYVDVKNHNQKIDGKNLMHCYRLLETAKEIALTNDLKVRRDNAEFLLDIRKGNYNLDQIINKANDLIIEVTDLFNQSSLKDNIDQKLINNILINLRKQSIKFI